MMGMSQIKKKTIQGILIGVAIGVVGIGLTLWWAISTIDSYQKGTNKKFKEKYFVTVSVPTRDISQGEIITDDMITEQEIHKVTAPHNSLSSADIVGKVANYNIAANMPIVESMVADDIISADIRSQEINTVVMPSDLFENEYVDIRIMYPNGTDYIVLAQKIVKKINGQTMWLDLAEDERLLLNAAVVDSFLHSGTKLYATKYTDSDSQVKVVKDEKIEVDDDTTGDTTVTTTETGGTVKTQDVTKIVQGKLRAAIESEIEAMQTETTDQAVETVFDLVLKYRSYANAITRTIENYQPNTQVMEMMKANGNILEEAKEKLSAEARANIENGIENYKTDTGENYSNVVSGAQTAISNQKALRNELLVDTTTTDTTTTE